MIDRCESIKSDQFANYGEHGDLCAAGWREVEWYRGGFLRGGYANQGEEGTQQWRERLWLSPHCLGKVATAQLSLLADPSDAAERMAP